MADGTKIEWTDATWSIVAGCDHVSPGCDNCYAARLTSGRLKNLPAYQGLAQNGRFTGEVRTRPDLLEQPLTWRKPRRIFVSGMADLFHDKVEVGFIAHAFAIMAATPRHTYQVLSKRHGRMRSLLGDQEFRRLVHEYAWAYDQDGRYDPYRYVDHAVIPIHYERPSTHLGDDSDWWPLPNVWLGVSCEDQKWADIRVPALLRTPAAVRFISAEPLLGPVDLKQVWFHCPVHDSADGLDFCVGGCPDMRGLDWVISGGESGPGARPASPDWFRSLRDQCQAAKVAYFHKQNGQKRAGRELDGREWSEYPAVTR